MSTNMNTQSDAKKYGIDLRLDAIDRALLGLLPRHERIEIVAQIETRIRDSAADCAAVDAQCEKARPDFPDPADEAMDAAVISSLRPSRGQRRFSPRRRPRSRLAVSSGVLGMVALALLMALPIVYFMVSMLDDSGSATVWLLGGNVMAVALAGLLAVALGIAALVVLNRHGGRLVGHGWAVTGLCTGPLPMFVGGLVALVVGAQLGTISVTPAYTTNTVPPPGPLSMNPGMNPYQPPQGVPVPSYSAPPPTPVGAMPSPTGFDPYADQPAYVPGTLVPAPPSIEAAPSYGSTPQSVPETSSVPTTRAEPSPPVPTTSSPQGFDYNNPPLSSPVPSTSSPPSVAPEPPPGAPASTATPADIDASRALRAQ